MKRDASGNRELRRQMRGNPAAARIKRTEQHQVTPTPTTAKTKAHASENDHHQSTTPLLVR
jgi:hypothetical protein